MAAALNPNATAYVPSPLALPISPPFEYCYYSSSVYPSLQQSCYYASPTTPHPELYQCLSPQIITRVLPSPLPLLQVPQLGVTITLLGDEEEIREVSDKPQDNRLAVCHSSGRDGVQKSDCNDAVKGEDHMGYRRSGRSGGSLVWRKEGFTRKGSTRQRRVKESFEIELGKLEVMGGDGRTTLMIKNIPNKFTKGKLLGILDQHCFEENQKLLEFFEKNSSEMGEREEVETSTVLSEFDFLYLPIDFRSGSNMGYAFVNFTSATAAWRLYKSLHKYAWKSHGSRKVCEVTYARIQGLPALLEHFRRSVFVCGSDYYLPVRFSPPRNGHCPSEESCIGKRIPVFDAWC